MDTPLDAAAVLGRLEPLLKAVQARRDADHIRLVPHLRTIARTLIPDAEISTVQDASAVLGDPTLCEKVDDLDRTAEAERSRLRAVDADEDLRLAHERTPALRRRREQAEARSSELQAEVARFDSEAFRWLQKRRRYSESEGIQRLWRTVSFAEWREQRVEAELSADMEVESFATAAQAYGRAEAGLRRAALDVERAAHAEAALIDLVAEHADLQERVASEPSRRRRSLRDYVEASLIDVDLAEVHSRAPEGVRPLLAEGHAVGTRLKGWADIESALSHQRSILARLPSRVQSAEDQATVDHASAVVAAANHVVDKLAAFHDYDRWAGALDSGAATCCWDLLSDSDNGVDDAILVEVIPRLHHRPPARPPTPTPSGANSHAEGATG